MLSRQTLLSVHQERYKRIATSADFAFASDCEDSFFFFLFESNFCIVRVSEESQHMSQGMLGVKIQRGDASEKGKNCYLPQGISSAQQIVGLDFLQSVVTCVFRTHTYTQTAYPLICHVPILVSILYFYLYLCSCVKHFVTL